jgi:hypothetical protein
MINGLDIAILTIFMGIVGFGFTTGVTKVFAALLATYFATVGSAVIYQPLAAFGQQMVPSMGTISGELASFFVLFLFFAAVLTVLVSRWIGGVRLPRRLAVLDNLGGAAVGVVVSALAVTLAAVAMGVLLQALHQSVTVAGRGPMISLLDHQIGSSRLLPVFLRFSPVFLRAIAPWFPSGLPPILDVIDPT